MKTKIQKLQQEIDELYLQVQNTEHTNVCAHHKAKYNKLTKELIKLKLQHENTNNGY